MKSSAFVSCEYVTDKRGTRRQIVKVERQRVEPAVQMSKGTWLTPHVAAWLLANPPLTCREAIIYCSVARLALQQSSGYLMQMFPNESDGKYQQALRNCG